jgi:ubiquinone biosynthesis protein
MQRARMAFMQLLGLLFRGVWISWVIALGLLGYLGTRIGSRALSELERERLRGDALTATLQRLGATFIKFGQILGSRPDLLGPGYIEALTRLQDRVAAAPYADVETVLAAEFSTAERARLVSIEATPIAAASVAQVHRATLDTGEVIALKVQRLAAAGQIDRDLSLMMLGARCIHAFPQTRFLSLPGSVERFAESLRGQLDFRAEADNNRRFTHNFANVPEIGVPKLIDGLCTRRVLAMEFVDGVKASEPEKVGGDRIALARTGCTAVAQMVFIDGFVHADLHPGNLIISPDGRLFLIDLGMVARIPNDLMRPWIETFTALAQQDGKAAARLFYVYAPTVGTRDYPAFEAEVVEHFNALYGLSLGDVEISEALGGIMNVLRRHRVQIDPSFTVVHVALLVAEGLGKQLDPNVDLIALTVPYLVRALAEAPPARPVNREVPALV